MTWLQVEGTLRPRANDRRVARSRVDLSEPHEVRYWMGDLGVDQATLRAVVEAVGNSASRVRRYVQGGKHKA